MADLTVIGAQVAPLYPLSSMIRAGIGAAPINPGQALFLNSAGKYDLASAAAAGTAQYRGLSLGGSALGQSVDVLQIGAVGGFALAGVPYDGLVYLSNTPGAFADAPGTITVQVGRVVARSDSTLTKALHTETDFRRNW